MNILVIGASGRVGQKLTEQLLDAGHKVTGTARDKDTLFENNNYTQLDLDLSASNKDIEAQITEDFDAVYFTAGSGGKDVLAVDLHGAVKTMQMAEVKGISRYIMLSAVYSLDTSKWDAPSVQALSDYYIAKHYADDFLIHRTNLDYTIVQPGALTEEAPTHEIDINSDEAGSNTISDVAETLAGVLTAENTYKQVFAMQNGKTPIKQAIGIV